MARIQVLHALRSMARGSWWCLKVWLRRQLRQPQQPRRGDENHPPIIGLPRARVLLNDGRPARLRAVAVENVAGVAVLLDPPAPARWRPVRVWPETSSMVLLQRLLQQPDRLTGIRPRDLGHEALAVVPATDLGGPRWLLLADDDMGILG